MIQKYMSRCVCVCVCVCVRARVCVRVRVRERDIYYSFLLPDAIIKRIPPQETM